MPGPPPNPNARRRNARPDWRRLPTTGRPGDPPPWPMGRAGKAVLDLWAQLWASPQALAWEDLGWTRVVARYTKLLVAAEKSDAPIGLLGEVRQLEDRLGLSPMAMRRLQWEIDAVPAAPAGDEGSGGEVTRLDAYRNLYGDAAGS